MWHRVTFQNISVRNPSIFLKWICNKVGMKRKWVSLAVPFFLRCPHTPHYSHLSVSHYSKRSLTANSVEKKNSIPGVLHNWNPQMKRGQWRANDLFIAGGPWTETVRICSWNQKYIQAVSIKHKGLIYLYHTLKHLYAIHFKFWWITKLLRQLRF